MAPYFIWIMIVIMMPLFDIFYTFHFVMTRKERHVCGYFYFIIFFFTAEVKPPMSGPPPGDFDEAPSRPQDPSNSGGPSDLPPKPAWYDPQHMGPWNPSQPVKKKKPPPSTVSTLEPIKWVRSSRQPHPPSPHLSLSASFRPQPAAASVSALEQPRGDVE